MKRAEPASKSTQKTSDHPLLTKLRKRRIVETLAAFIAGGWLIIEVVHWILIDHYHFPEKTLDITIVLLICALLCTMLWRWFGSIKETRAIFWKWSLIIMILVVMAVVEISLFLRLDEHGESHAAVSESSRKIKNSIAVLPFADMSQAKDQEYFCDGMADEIINTLGNIEDLHVIARTSAFAFKGKNEDIREIGRKLNVENLLEGSVRKAGNQLRVVVRLVRTSDGTQLWSQRYDQNLTDVFAIQDSIALGIVNYLKIKLLGREEARIAMRFTDNLEAFNQYLKGRLFLNRRKKEDIFTAISYFERALELDPNYVMGYIGLADANALLVPYTSEAPGIAFPKAKEAVFKALKINDQIGEAYASLGWIRILADWDWEGAEEVLQKAVELNPGYATAFHWYGYLYMYLGQFDKSITLVTRALELDPLSPIINRVIGDVYYQARHYDKAISALNKTFELEPCVPFSHLILSNCYRQKAMFEEAIEEILKERECRKNNSYGEDQLGVIYAVMGETKKARLILERLRAEGVGSPLGMSQLCFALGENDMGFEILEDMYRTHNVWVHMINIIPVFDPVREDPRFQALLKKIGF